MTSNLLQLVTGDLLRKFGAGNHKPGSGSASAFQGMLAAQMLKTVIDLTCDKKRYSQYSSQVSKFLNCRSQIEVRINKRLEELFQLDSEIFDKVIRLREERDQESNYERRRKLAKYALEELKTATEIPLEIADLCLELVAFANDVFDFGFRAARGDSGVALHAAISAVGSCLCIVELNLCSFGIDEWTEHVRQHKRNVREKFEKIQSLGHEKIEILEKESEAKMEFHNAITYFESGDLADVLKSNAQIEEMARRLQNILWIHKEKIWKKTMPKDELGILNADDVLTKVLQYDYLETSDLGIYESDGELFQVAGFIDKHQRVVKVAKSLPPETKRFTVAHELGHAIMHKQLILHRDRPIDGSHPVQKKIEEVQADSSLHFS